MTLSLQPGHDDVGGELFQASAQQALALANQGEHPGHAWVVLSVARLPDASALSAHLATLGARHEILRTLYRRLPGMAWPLQAVQAQVPGAVHAEADRDWTRRWPGPGPR